MPPTKAPVEKCKPMFPLPVILPTEKAKSGAELPAQKTYSHMDTVSLFVGLVTVWCVYSFVHVCQGSVFGDSRQTQ